MIKTANTSDKLMGVCGLIFLCKGNENNLNYQFAGSKTVARVSKYEISQIGDKDSIVYMPHKLHFFDSTTEKTI